MLKIRGFLIRHPIASGFLLILLFTTLSTLTWPITQINTEPEGFSVGEAFAKIVMTLVFLLILAGFRRVRAAGFLSLGSRQIWFWTIGLAVISVVASIYAFTGSFWIGMPAFRLTGSILFFAFATALLEETIYRGLLLTIMVEAWGGSRRGLYRAAVVSGLFFASLHLFNLLVRPLSVVGLQVLNMVLVGFLYAGIVLAGRSIWPAVFFHWMINFWTHLQVFQIEAFEETIDAWLIKTTVLVVVVIIAIYVLGKLLPGRSVVSGEEDDGQPMKEIQV